MRWSGRRTNGDPAKGETNTNAPLVVKDKVITGISGGEYGVRGFVVAYDIATGRQVWKAYSVGPDSELLVDPRRTTHLGRPIGANSSLSTWEGEQWRLGGGTTWGWFTYDPALNLIYYGSGNPGHLESRRAPRRQPLEHDACSRATRTPAWRSGCIR